MKFKLISLEKIEYESDVFMVIVPVLDGEVGIMEYHESTVIELTSGKIKLFLTGTSKNTDEDQEILEIDGGVMKVEDNIIEVLVDLYNGVNKVLSNA